MGLIRCHGLLTFISDVGQTVKTVMQMHVSVVHSVNTCVRATQLTVKTHQSILNGLTDISVNISNSLQIILLQKK